MPMSTLVHADHSRELHVEDERHGMVVVHLAGTLDARDAAALETLVDAQLNPVGRLRRLVLDLSAVEFVAAPYLSALLTVQQRCHARSVRLCLLGCRQQVVGLLHETGLVDRFRRYSTLADIATEHA